MAFGLMSDVAGELPGQTINFSRAMAVSTLASNTPFWASGWAITTGYPGGATYPSASLTWVIPTSATTGALKFTDPPGGLTSYVARFQSHSLVNKTKLVLYDRLAHTGLITPANSTQTLTTTPLTRPDANGASAELWWECINATVGTGFNLTATYTNQAGTSSHVTISVTVPTTAVVGQMVNLPLAAGDTGIQTVQSVTMNAASTGTGMLVLLRRVAEITAGSPTSEPYPPLDALSLGMPTISNGACLALMGNAGTTGIAASAQGFFNIIQG